MTISSLRLLAGLFIAALLPASALASEAVDSPRVVADAVTHHQVTINRTRIAFTARAGETLLHDWRGEPTASIFSFAYLKDGADAATRPVLFAIGGGPGSASTFLHVGLLGPWAVPLDRLSPESIGKLGNLPPVELVENPLSPLDVADIVFIDPVGTGYSRPLKGGDAQSFWSADGDLEAVAQFIEQWLTKNGRWNSPKFFLGESYGSMRAARISEPLLGGPYSNGLLRGITLNGLILLATTLDAFPESMDAPPKTFDPDLASALAVPGAAATAWYHGTADRGGASVGAFVEDARRFAMDAYLSALRKDASKTLSPEERKAVQRQLSRFTGLPAATFGKDLRISAANFAKTGLAARGLQLGQYDSRYTLPLSDSAVNPVGDDPALSQAFPVWTAAMHRLLDEKLNVRMGRPYHHILWKPLLYKWNFKRGDAPQEQSFAVDLADSMRRVSGMHVLVTGGYYDLVTPAAAVRHALDQVNVPADRLTLKTYEGGHDLYVSPAAAAIGDDIRALIRAASKLGR